jgi:hypothetical protein
MSLDKEENLLLLLRKAKEIYGIFGWKMSTEKLMNIHVCRNQMKKEG